MRKFWAQQKTNFLKTRHEKLKSDQFYSQIYLKNHLKSKEIRRVKNNQAREMMNKQNACREKVVEFDTKMKLRKSQNEYQNWLLEEAQKRFKERVECRSKLYQKLWLENDRKNQEIKLNTIRKRYELGNTERLITIMAQEIHRKEKINKENKQNILRFNDRIGISPIVASYKTSQESETGFTMQPGGLALITKNDIQKSVELAQSIVLTFYQEMLIEKVIKTAWDYIYYSSDGVMCLLFTIHYFLNTYYFLIYFCFRLYKICHVIIL